MKTERGKAQHDELQFYPTGKELARRAWSMFENKEISRLLEPSAGRGDLVIARLREPRHEYDEPRLGFEWDAVEIDASHHALLRERGATVVGHDFLAHSSCAIYSHILMNPPFNQGARHVLHAWNTLFDGEIVAIINAETLRNLCSAERVMLARIVAQHGRVEFVKDAFKGEDILRTTDVEIALIHLVKRADHNEMVGNIISGLKQDDFGSNDLGWTAPQELALPTNFVEATVNNFNLALVAIKDAAISSARAQVYRARLGKTMEMLQQKDQNAESRPPAPAGETVREIYARNYEDLKNAAWTQILRSTHVMSRLSHAAQKRVESEFENIRALEFTIANVYGFLHGLVEKAGDIQMSMVCDVFDLITRYHSDNTVYYMGWKSNDQHRTAAMRVKRTRFVIPSESYNGWSTTASWDVTRLLADFDRVFSMLDGKRECDVGLASLFGSPDSYKRLVRGERLTSDYFDVRYYRGRGTIHFFPRNIETIERLNRVVGQYRSWLPPSMDEMDPDFRTQYEKAEKFCAEVVKTVNATSSVNGYWGSNAMARLTSSSKEAREEANAAAVAALIEVLDRHGLHPQQRLNEARKQEPLLLVA